MPIWAKRYFRVKPRGVQAVRKALARIETMTEAFREIRDRATGFESVAKAQLWSGVSATIGGVARKLGSSYLGIMDRMGVELDEFGDADSRLGG